MLFATRFVIVSGRKLGISLSFKDKLFHEFILIFPNQIEYYMVFPYPFYFNCLHFSILRILVFKTEATRELEHPTDTHFFIYLTHSTVSE